MGTKNKGVFGGPVNENEHPRGFARLTGKRTSLDNGNRDLLGIRVAGEYPAAALSLAPLGSRRLAPLSVPTKRMASARDEISHVLEFEYIIVNDKFEVALADLIAVVRAARVSRAQQSVRLEHLIDEFR